MADNQNAAEAAQSLQPHNLENQTQVVVRTQRYQRALSSLRYAAAIIVVVVILVGIVRALISGSSEEVGKLPGLIKQLIEISPIRERSAQQTETSQRWQNVTSRP